MQKEIEEEQSEMPEQPSSVVPQGMPGQMPLPPTEQQAPSTQDLNSAFNAQIAK